MSAEEEAARAAAFREQAVRRAAFLRQRKASLAGNKAARKALAEKFAPFSRTIRK